MVKELGSDINDRVIWLQYQYCEQPETSDRVERKTTC